MGVSWKLVVQENTLPTTLIARAYLDAVILVV